MARWCGVACRGSTRSRCSANCSIPTAVRSRRRRRVGGWARSAISGTRMSWRETAEGAFRVVDFAPRYLVSNRAYRPTQLVRIVEPLSGAPRIVVLVRAVLRLGEADGRFAIRVESNAYPGFDDELRPTTAGPLTYLESGQPWALTERTFWLVEALTRMDRAPEARVLFESAIQALSPTGRQDWNPVTPAMVELPPGAPACGTDPCAFASSPIWSEVPVTRKRLGSASMRRDGRRRRSAVVDAGIVRGVHRVVAASHAGTIPPGAVTNATRSAGISGAAAGLAGSIGVVGRSAGRRGLPDPVSCGVLRHQWPRR